MVMVVAAWNKSALDWISVGCYEAFVDGFGCRITNRGSCGSGADVEVDFMPWPRHRGDARSGVDMGAWSFSRCMVTPDLQVLVGGGASSSSFNKLAQVAMRFQSSLSRAGWSSWTEDEFPTSLIYAHNKGFAGKERRCALILRWWYG